MALLATLPHTAQLVRSTTSYLVAPAPLDDGVAYLTVPRRGGGPSVTARVTGDRLVVVRTTGAHELVNGDCGSAIGCAAVGAPVADAKDVVFGLPAEGGGGYVGRSGATGRIAIVHNDEAGDTVPLYAAAGGRTVFEQHGAIATRTGTAPATIVVAPAATGGTVRALSASPDAVAWVARAGSRSPWKIAVRVGANIPRGFDEARRGIRIGTPAVSDDGTVAWAQRLTARTGVVLFQIVVLKPGALPKVVAQSPLVSTADHDPVPRVALAGTTIVYRLRAGAGGRSEAIFATDLKTLKARLIARKGRRAARISDPAASRTRIVWAQADFRAGQFVRSRILRVRASL